MAEAMSGASRADLCGALMLGNHELYSEIDGHPEHPAALSTLRTRRDHWLGIAGEDSLLRQVGLRLYRGEVIALSTPPQDLVPSQLLLEKMVSDPRMVTVLRNYLLGSEEHDVEDPVGSLHAAIEDFRRLLPRVSVAPNRRAKTILPITTLHSLAEHILAHEDRAIISEE